MSIKDRQTVALELQRLNQRKLRKGELVLLSYCLASQIPVVPTNIENARMHVLAHKQLIMETIYAVNNYSYIDTNEQDFIEDCVVRFVSWRTAVSTGKMKVLFTGESDMVVDQLSGLTGYFDPGVLCSVGEEALSANWLLRTFTELVSCCTLDIQKHTKE